MFVSNTTLNQDMLGSESQIWEIVGIAGSGKTTIFHSLLEKNSKFIERPSLRKKKFILLWLISVVKTLSCYIEPKYFINRRKLILHKQLIRSKKRYLLFEFYLISYLTVLTAYLKKCDRNNRVIVFDQGPVFIIAALNALGTTSVFPKVKKTCDECIVQLKESLSCIIYLDIPEKVSLERCKKRNDWTKYMDVFKKDINVLSHLSEYVRIYNDILKIIKKSQKVRVLTIDNYNCDESMIVDYLINFLEQFIVKIT